MKYTVKSIVEGLSEFDQDEPVRIQVCIKRSGLWGLFKKYEVLEADGLDIDDHGWGLCMVLDVPANNRPDGW